MFKLSSDPKFTHDVEVCVPVDGGHKKEVLSVTYRVVDIEQLGDTVNLDGQQQLLRKIVCGVQGVEDDAGQPIPYSDDLRDRLIGVPFVRAAMFGSYLAAVTKTRVGN